MRKMNKTDICYLIIGYTNLFGIYTDVSVMGQGIDFHCILS